MEASKKRVYSPKVETRLTRADLNRLDEAAKTAEKTRSDFVRQAVLWYLDNQENLEHDKRETEVAKAMKYATDQHVKAINSGVERICKMLARQGAAIGTLYELSWMALPDDENAKMAFEAAANTAKQKMRKHVERDEAELSEKMKKVVTSK
ncbi:MAG: ribbon-helix-helix protein, CopG family [Candidatus Melainabacteria bacterium]|nr:ribbon-helix-helix protein, CopG family [Candidatus Melainabacteria bacterium]